MIIIDPAANARQLFTDNFGFSSDQIIEWLLYAPLLALSLYCCNPSYAKIVCHRFIAFQRVWLIGSFTHMFQIFIIDGWHEAEAQSRGNRCELMMSGVFLIIMGGIALLFSSSFVVLVAVLALIIWPFLHYTALGVGETFWVWVIENHRRMFADEGRIE